MIPSPTAPQSPLLHFPERPIPSSPADIDGERAIARVPSYCPLCAAYRRPRAGFFNRTGFPVSRARVGTDPNQGEGGARRASSPVSSTSKCACRQRISTPKSHTSVHSGYRGCGVARREQRDSQCNELSASRRLPHAAAQAASWPRKLLSVRRTEQTPPAPCPPHTSRHAVYGEYNTHAGTDVVGPHHRDAHGSRTNTRPYLSC